MNKVGELLKKERIRQGLEIRDIENAISVRELYLRAIEEGNHKVVPGEVYLKGFIRNYAIQLGLDPQEVMKVYQEDKGLDTTADTPAADAPLQETQPLPVMQPVEEQQFRSRKYNRRDRREEKKKSFLGGWGKVVLAMLILAGAVVWGGGLSLFDTPFSQESPAEEYAQRNTKTPGSNANVAPNAGQAGNIAPAAVKDVTVTIKYTGNCWTEVRIDGKPEYAGTPRAGETLDFSGKDRIVVKLGSAGAADVTHNGKAIGSLGRPGSVVERTFTKDGIPAAVTE